MQNEFTNVDCRVNKLTMALGLLTESISGGGGGREERESFVSTNLKKAERKFISLKICEIQVLQQKQSLDALISRVLGCFLAKENNIFQGISVMMGPSA